MTQGDMGAFLKALMAAWEADDRRAALSGVLRQVVSRDSASTHNEHCANTRAFFEQVERQLQLDRVAKSHFLEAIRSLLTDLATDTWEGKPEDLEALLSFCEGHPQLAGELGALREELAPSLGSRVPLFLTLRRGPEAQVIHVPLGPEAVSVPDVVPGEYSLTLSTGQLLWEGEVRPEQVIWSRAFPGRALPMAAETDLPVGEPTYVVDLLGAELSLTLHAGLEAGTLRLARRGEG